MTTATNNALNHAVAMPFSAIELEVLRACHELTLCNKELLPLLAAALQVPEEQLFYTWMFRRPKRRGHVEGSNWVYSPHGHECDVKNTADGRSLRIDFGPGGRVDTFTILGVVKFVMTSVAPWPEFPLLKQSLAGAKPMTDWFWEQMQQISPVWERLEARGVFARAAPDLVALQARYTTLNAEGIQYVQFPQGTSEETMIDCSVAHRTVLSPYGRSIVEGQLDGYQNQAPEQAS